MCGLNLMVLSSAPSGFCPGSMVFPSYQKPTFDLFQPPELEVTFKVIIIIPNIDLSIIVDKVTVI